MKKIVHGLYGPDNRDYDPLLGALLRRPFLAVRARIIAGLHAAGFTDLQAAHLAVFQYPGPHQRSPGDIARGAQVSKQAMNNLLGQLEQTGYLRRQPSPTDNRQRLVTLTPRGRKAVANIRHSVAAVEAEWQRMLGPETYLNLRTALARLNERLDD